MIAAEFLIIERDEDGATVTLRPVDGPVEVLRDADGHIIGYLIEGEAP